MSLYTAGQTKRQKTNDDSFTAAENDRKNASSPTGNNLLLALCRVDDTDNYSTDEVNKALDDIYTWRATSDNTLDECVKISKEFIEFGGIPRILIFFKGNKDNIGFVLRASKVIRTFCDTFLYFLSEDELEIASKMSRKFVEREGVEMMLSFINKKCTGVLDTDQLETLACIFAVFTNTIFEIDNFSPIIDTAISTMAILNNISAHEADVAHVKKGIFRFFQNYVIFKAEMIDAVDFHEKNIFQECALALTYPVNNFWKYDKDVWGEASGFFYESCYQNRKILSREGDFEVIISFCIHFIKVDPDYALASWTFKLLRLAIDTIGRKTMINNNKGLLEVLGTVADCGNDNVFDGTRAGAISLMKHLFDES